jgi:hypothetical protein
MKGQRGWLRQKKRGGQNDLFNPRNVVYAQSLEGVLLEHKIFRQQFQVLKKM